MSRVQTSDLERQIGAHLDAGDLSAAAAAMVRGYGEEILSYLIGVTRESTVADEVFSLVTEDLWRGLPGFRREASARTWLYRIAWNALQRYRSDPFRKRQRHASSELARVADHVRSRTAPFLRTEVKDAVSQLRQRLTPEEQTLLILRVDRALSWKEVGQIMADGDEALSEATLAKRYQRVRARLRKLAEDAGLLTTPG